MKKESIKKEINIEQEPRCQKCHRVMFEATTYFFPESHTPRRIDVPYFTCPTDKMAKLNIEKLKKMNLAITITDKVVDDIKKFRKKNYISDCRNNCALRPPTPSKREKARLAISPNSLFFVGR